MRRILASSVLVFVLLGTALLLPGTALAGVLKFDFTITNPDGSSTIVQASSRTNKQGNVTVCNYNGQNGAFLGEVQGSTSGTMEDVESFCRVNAPITPSQ
jgi:hypothetical protein